MNGSCGELHVPQDIRWLMMREWTCPGGAAQLYFRQVEPFCPRTNRSGLPVHPNAGYPPSCGKPLTWQWLYVDCLN